MHLHTFLTHIGGVLRLQIIEIIVVIFADGGLVDGLYEEACRDFVVLEVFLDVLDRAFDPREQ